MYEAELSNVKVGLAARLGQGELNERDYWQAAYELLLGEGVVE
jgi:hypothetical protein|tara:strand:+ start:975 stop:1103 length:129 start_codon:yes stop_codon:yes gene_type:complete